MKLKTRRPLEQPLIFGTSQNWPQGHDLQRVLCTATQELLPGAVDQKTLGKGGESLSQQEPVGHIRATAWYERGGRKDVGKCCGERPRE